MSDENILFFLYFLFKISIFLGHHFIPICTSFNHISADFEKNPFSLHPLSSENQNEDREEQKNKMIVFGNANSFKIKKIFFKILYCPIVD